MEKPRLRPIEFVPVMVEGQPMFHLNDPRGIAQGLLLSPGAARVAVEFFNGRHTVADVQAAVLEAGGGMLPSEDLQKLIAMLDRQGFLESETFQARLEVVRKAYRDSPHRAAHLAGATYPDEGRALAEFLDDMLEEARGEGARRVPRLRVLVAPHIDFERGGAAYGFAYEALRGAARPETVIVLGTGHQVQDHAFVVTDKDFQTPLGTVATDRDGVARLVEACGEELLCDQHEHRTEHSVEFQAVFLRHVLGDAFSMVPVLCGAFPPPDGRVQAPRRQEAIRRFVNALASVIRERDGNCLVVASVDFAHVGPRFGAETPVDDALLEAVEHSDRELLDALCKGDGEALYQRLSRDANRYSVCGYAAMYTALAAVPGLAGELLYYGQAVHPEGQEAVTFASVALA